MTKLTAVKITLFIKLVPLLMAAAGFGTLTKGCAALGEGSSHAATAKDCSNLASSECKKGASPSEWFGFSFFCFFASLALGVSSEPFKFVKWSGDYLYVSDLWERIKVPIDHVTEIKHMRVGRQPSFIVFLSTRCRFGVEIVFIPRRKYYERLDDVRDQLCDAIASFIRNRCN